MLGVESMISGAMGKLGTLPLTKMFSVATGAAEYEKLPIRKGGWTHCRDWGSCLGDPWFRPYGAQKEE